MMIYFGSRPLGKNMKQLRQRRRLSLQKLSQLADVHPLTLYCIEAGFLQDIEYESLKRLCTALHTNIETLTDEKYEL